MKHDEILQFDHRKRRPIVPALLKEYGLWCCWCHISSPEEIPENNPHPYTACPKRLFCQYAVAHMFSGKGHIWTETGLDQDLEAGDLIVMPPNVVNRYGSIRGTCFIEDNFSFDGPLADMLRRTGIIAPKVYHIGTFRRLVPIAECLTHPSVQVQLRGNLLLQNLLMDLHFEELSSAPKHNLIETITQIIKEHPERWWTVQDLAELCKLSEVQTRRIFLKQTGLPPKQYIDLLKLQAAGNVLRTSRKTVAKVAAEFGYRDPFHFSRRFKALMGSSPELYRK